MIIHNNKTYTRENIFSIEIENLVSDWTKWKEMLDINFEAGGYLYWNFAEWIEKISTYRITTLWKEEEFSIIAICAGINFISRAPPPPCFTIIRCQLKIKKINFAKVSMDRWRPLLSDVDGRKLVTRVMDWNSFRAVGKMDGAQILIRSCK